jgi:hypothetical protein
MAIWSIFRPFGLFYGNYVYFTYGHFVCFVTVWYIFWLFATFYPFWYVVP